MELKARHVVDVYDNYSEHPCKESSQVYLKSEADKVIAEQESEIRNLRRSLIVARHEVAKARGKKFSNKYRAIFKEGK